MKKVYFIFQDGVEEPLDVMLDKYEAHKWAEHYQQFEDEHARLRVHAATYELV